MEIKKSKHLKRIKFELKKARQDLEDLENYITEFNYFLPLAVCSLSSLGTVIDVNYAFQKLTKYHLLEIFGKPLTKIVLEKEKFKNFIKKSQRKKKTIEGDFNLITKEGKKIPVNIALSTRQDKSGNLIGYLVALSDITRVKEYQKELEKKVEERTRELRRKTEQLENIKNQLAESLKRVEEEKNKNLAIIQNLTDGLLVFDKENKLSLINSQAENFFEIKEKEIIGQHFLKLKDFPNFQPLINLLGEKIKGVFRKELPVKENLVLEVTTIPIVAGEEKLGTLIIFHDITRERIVERMKTEFVSISAHQLRTPLSAIKWTLRMLLDGDLGELTQEQKEFLQKTYQSNERMINLINDLLSVSRIEEGRYLYKPTFANLEEIIESLYNSLKEEAKRKNLKFEFKKPNKKLPEIKVDVEKITLAIQNLIENAIRYTLPGGKVTIFLKQKDKEIEFSVKDTGIGIPKEQQNRIFTKFFRGGNAMKIETRGSGLGLFIAKNIIEAHGGKIWFESKEGEGTTFYFTLPRESI